jgi:(1->4)-alpha-D-glucan 1-alpha-D-glucosylmutase
LPRYPVATYRVQLNQEFPFSKARDLLPFLQKLGISDLYASPVFVARPGSTHGYDVVDPTAANPELGGEVGFDALAADLRSRGMGLLLDIVPNHMAASPSNAWWTDVLENGASSIYAAFFDVEWDPAWDRGDPSIFIPVLGSRYGTVLENQEIRLDITESGFVIRYYAVTLPVDPGTYTAILDHRSDDVPQEEAWRALIESLRRLPSRSARMWEGIEARRREIPNIKAQLWALYQSSPAVRRFIDRTISEFNGVKGEPDSFDLLDDLLARQPYRLAWWQVARERMNYRRFFDVSELVGVRVENDEVFAATHNTILRWIREGKVTGLRVDHVDGLYKPREYLDRLAAVEPRPYILVEKILIEDETLPENWPVDGTTGYDFLGILNGVFIDGASLPLLQDTYSRFTGLNWTFEDAAREQKRWIVRHLFRGEMFALSLHLELIAELDRHGRDLSPEELRRALTEVTACLPVYRTYLESERMPLQDARYIEAAVAEARRLNSEVSPPVFDFIRRVLLCDFPHSLTPQARQDWVRFVMRWQQLTGPITAKGVEDTTMYVYNRLLSMNEVGAQHGPVTLQRFHEFNRERQRRWPYAMNTTSTHDTKRSGDVRARLNVLSELPSEWNRYLFRWARWNREFKTLLNGRPVPDANEETLIYQTLLGAWPNDPADVPAFIERLKQYATKALREAKIYTSWLKPDEEHERAVHRFIETILEPRPGNRFLEHFLDFEERIAYFGALNSLAQVLIKITAPGIPDFYQNTTLWDLSLVDPDNRRPIELDARLKLAEELGDWNQPGTPASLLAGWKDGRIKTFVIYRALQFRRRLPGLFLHGEYVPVQSDGLHRERVIAFARRSGDAACLVVVPRFTTHLVGSERPPVGRRVWKDTILIPPEGFAQRKWKNVMSGEAVDSLALGNILATFPVALLETRE